MFVIFFTNDEFSIYLRKYFKPKSMKLFTPLLTLSLILMSCGQANMQSSQSAWERLSNQILSEDANSTAMSDMRVTYQENCRWLQEAYLDETHEAFSYQIISEIESRASRNCLLWYYYGTESDIYTYALYNLSTDTLLWEVSCEPEYNTENDINWGCSDDALQNLRMEYEYLLETYRNI